MAKMSGLGKGLDALFGPAPEEEQMQENDILKNLKVTEVEPNSCLLYTSQLFQKEEQRMKQ